MTMTALRLVRAAGCAAALLLAREVSAQTLPSEPLTFGGGRIVVSGDAAVSVAPEDEGFFNYSDYEQTTLRQVRFGMAASVRVSDRYPCSASCVPRTSSTSRPSRCTPDPTASQPPVRRADRPDSTDLRQLLAAYLRARQSAHRLPDRLPVPDVAAPDSVPADLDELVRMRGRGWLSSFSWAIPTRTGACRSASAFTWDTGVQASGGWNMVAAAVSVTTGTASNPLVSDDNSGKQMSFRTTVTPALGLVLGTSYTRGEFLDRHVQSLLSIRTRTTSISARLRVDVEYSRDHWLARAEVLRARGRSRSAPPARHASSRAGHDGRRPLHPCSRLVRSRARRTSRLQPDRHPDTTTNGRRLSRERKSESATTCSAT
jgi:hypothetical protein